MLCGSYPTGQRHLTTPGSTHPRRTGAAVVEMAVVLPVLVVVIFGIIEFGRAFMVQHILNEIARRACRTAVGLQSQTVTTAGYSSSNWNDYINATVVDPLCSYNGISGYTTEYFVTAYGTTPTYTTTADVSTASTYSSSGGMYSPGSEIHVRVTVPWGNVSWGGRYLSGYSLRGQYTLRRE
jgi:hypothetical protein